MVVTSMVLEIFSDEERTHLSDEVLYGHSVGVLERRTDGLFRVVTEQGYVGFCDPSCLWDVDAEKGAYRVHYRTDALASAEITATKVMTLPRFAHVSVEADCGAFYRVRLFDGREGYVHRAHLLPPKTGEATPDEVCDTALSLLGVPYRYGGRSAVALDCSGLVSLAFGFCGVVLPRDTADLTALPEVPAETERRGDLVLFDGHVGILLTRTRFVHASASFGFVAISSLDKRDPLYDSVHAPRGYSIRRVL